MSWSLLCAVGVLPSLMLLWFWNENRPVLETLRPRPRRWVP